MLGAFDIPNLEELVKIEDTGIISLFVSEGKFYFPIEAYNVLDAYQNNPLYGSKKDHTTYTPETLVINNNTFNDFIQHIILIGALPLECFQEILFHEVMHFCGSGGRSALREGLNEYLTRTLALKYNLKTNGCGYPKEIKIINELVDIFGEDVLRQISFSKSNEEIVLILESKRPGARKFFFQLDRTMDEEFYNKYYKFKYPGLTGPFEKAQKYSEINYDKAYKLIENYKKFVKLEN